VCQGEEDWRSHPWRSPVLLLLTEKTPEPYGESCPVRPFTTWVSVWLRALGVFVVEAAGGGTMFLTVPVTVPTALLRVCVTPVTVCVRLLVLSAGLSGAVVGVVVGGGLAACCGGAATTGGAATGAAVTPGSGCIGIGLVFTGDVGVCGAVRGVGGFIGGDDFTSPTLGVAGASVSSLAGTTPRTGTKTVRAMVPVATAPLIVSPPERPAQH
jgi:hypothetical protein